MPTGNTSSSYGSVARTLHWLTALLILTLIPLGLVANGMAADLRDPAVASTPADIERTFLLFSLHKTLGIATLAVAMLRIGWALSQPRPSLLNPDRRAEAFLAETVHWLLYGSLLLVPLTGWASHAATSGLAPILWPLGQSLPMVPKSDALAETFGALHVLFQRVLLVAIILHVLGAIKHHLIDRDATLRRMLTGANAAPQRPQAQRSQLPAVAALAVWAVMLGLAAANGALAPHSSAAPVTAAPTPAVAGWTVETGSIEITVTQFGAPLTGRFDRWSASITFDEPATPGPAGLVEVTIDTGSLTLGTVTAQALGPDFLDTQTHPTADFLAEIHRTDTGYAATGALTLRGQTVPVDLPFTLVLDGNSATMQGRTSLDRQDFAIGAQMLDESTLGFGVEVAITLTATRSEDARTGG